MGGTVATGPGDGNRFQGRFQDSPHVEGCEGVFRGIGYTLALEHGRHENDTLQTDDNPAVLDPLNTRGDDARLSNLQEMLSRPP